MGKVCKSSFSILYNSRVTPRLRKHSPIFRQYPNARYSVKQEKTFIKRSKIVKNLIQYFISIFLICIKFDNLGIHLNFHF